MYYLSSLQCLLCLINAGCLAFNVNSKNYQNDEYIKHEYGDKASKGCKLQKFQVEYF